MFRELTGTLFFVLLVAASVVTRGQDMHLSQQGENPVLLNPAYTGFYEGTGRFGLAYRNQWASVSVPFQTYTLTAETALSRDRHRLSGVNLGVIGLKDVAGSLDYGTLSGQLTLAWYGALNRQGTCIVSLGGEAGYAHSGFNPSAAEMEDPSDVFEKEAVNYPLVGAGVACYWQPAGEWQVKTGVALRNLNQPNISYLGMDDTRLKMLLNFYFRAEWAASQTVSLFPTVMAQRQGEYGELFYGMDVKYLALGMENHQMGFTTGLGFRHGDALVTHLTVEYDAWLFAVYYDANVSSLSAASNTLGAIEFSVLYRLVRGRGVRSIKCPVF